MQNKTGGAAFPRATGEARTAETQTVYNYAQTGMTLRQYYKAKVAAGWLANPDCIASASSADGFAREIGNIADALLVEDAEFEKQQGGGE